LHSVESSVAPPRGPLHQQHLLLDPQQLQVLLTLFAKFFSPFEQSTCALSITGRYLSFREIHLGGRGSACSPKQAYSGPPAFRFSTSEVLWSGMQGGQSLFSLTVDLVQARRRHREAPIEALSLAGEPLSERGFAGGETHTHLPFEYREKRGCHPRWLFPFQGID